MLAIAMPFFSLYTPLPVYVIQSSASPDPIPSPAWHIKRSGATQNKAAVVKDVPVCFFKSVDLTCYIGMTPSINPYPVIDSQEPWRYTLVPKRSSDSSDGQCAL